ncbi:Dihydropteroate synthase [Rubrobacter xylanophilus DSM 9941]|uniref:Dihydropteroate synthase n=1 Tax=Rubrobacter xylanophilus (strain DSM 9941 / JCM 11954 / NBRC 16129 / PRD-1) TaxID=266117 RepID=Q1AU00_RUBXD|nr:dihydropteroate synthase [Rubrobacter xylanophilus]ABG05128.1 Dihydropteroate synthase [Rubrobacter xylanophilus DSM 9941]
MAHTGTVRAGDRRLGPRPVLMGIVNVTPDSFSDAGEAFSAERAAERALRLLEEGADVIDVGGESTRPGADPVPVGEEIRRVVPAIREILAERPEAVVSVDTYRSETAEAALEAGALMVNDITALRGDPRMARLVAEAGCGVVLMHMRGTPKTMQRDPRYEDVVGEVREFLAGRAEAAVAAGVDPGCILLDPGIGFGKTLEHNLALLGRLDAIAGVGFPVLVGTSRKGFLGKITGAQSPKERVFGTVATSVLAYGRGAFAFRVHDVRANREALRVAAAVEEVSSP